MEFGKNNTKSIKQVLDLLVSKNGWEDKVVLGRIAESWKEIAGDKIDSVSTPYKLESGKLYILTDNASWRTELTLRKDELKEKINKKLGRNAINELYIK